jgi:hypothetical protein
MLLNQRALFRVELAGRVPRKQFFGLVVGLFVRAD